VAFQLLPHWEQASPPFRSIAKKYFNDIIVIADNDEAGNTMATNLQDKLGSSVSILRLDQKYKDVGEMDDEAIRALSFDFDASIAALLK